VGRSNFLNSCRPKRDRQKMRGLNDGTTRAHGSGRVRPRWRIHGIAMGSSQNKGHVSALKGVACCQDDENGPRGYELFYDDPHALLDRPTIYLEAGGEADSRSTAWVSSRPPSDADRSSVPARAQLQERVYDRVGRGHQSPERERGVGAGPPRTHSLSLRALKRATPSGTGPVAYAGAKRHYNERL